MRTMGVWVLAGVLVGAAMAQASDGDRDKGFAFKCRFALEGKGTEICVARGFVCKKGDDRSPCDSAMQIICGNEVAYQDGLRAIFGEDKIRLEGKDEKEGCDRVSITIRKSESIPSMESAVLRLKEAEGRGFCELKDDLPL